MVTELQKKMGGWIVEMVAPALIMIMTGSLAFFMLQVAYFGDYPGRIGWVLSLFIFASVLTSRISIIEGFEKATFYGMILGAATIFVLTTLSNFPLILAIIFIGVIWWFNSKLTWDCTVIDSTRDSTDRGLLSRIGFGSRSNSEEKKSEEEEPDDEEIQGTTSSEKLKSTAWTSRFFGKKKIANTPGVWVLILSLAAFPIFGIGQGFLEDDLRRQKAFFYFCTYLAAGLGLLVTTAMMGLQRYLQRRNATMPNSVAISWVGFGALMILAILMTAWILPRPNAEYSVAKNPFKFEKDSEWGSSQHSFGNEGKDDGRKGGQTDPSKEPTGDGKGKQKDGKNPSKGGDNKKGKSGSGKGKEKSSPGKGKSDPKSKSGQGGNQKKGTGKQKPGGKQKGDQGKSNNKGGKKQDNTKSNQPGKSPDSKGKSKGSEKGDRKGDSDSKNKPDADGKKNSDQKNDQPGKGKSNEGKSEKNKSDNNNSDSNKSDQSDSKGDSSENKNNRNDQNRNDQNRNEQNERQQTQGGGSAKSKENKKNSNKNSKSGKSSSPKKQSSSSSFKMPSFGGLLWILQWVVLIVVTIVGIFFAWKYRREIWQNFLNFLKELREFWANLWGKKGQDGTKEQARGTQLEKIVRKKSFAEFSNPYHSGQLDQFSVEMLVKYSFEALEAWGRERGVARDEDQTPHEFAMELVNLDKNLAKSAKKLADFYCSVAFAKDRLDEKIVNNELQQLWSRMQGQGLQGQLQPAVS